MVVDEAHQILTESDFRPQFKKLRDLADFGTQLIYLTASLPMRLEAQFLAEVCLPPDTLIIRAPSDQPQISYIKLTYNTMNTTLIRLAIDVAKIMTEVIGPDRKGIIFCSSISQADELGLKFTHKCVSHSQLPFEVKASNEEGWKTDGGSQYQWIAATTGMVCGIDDAHVGAVIFLGVGYGLVNLYQGAGRTGRDGNPSWAIVLRASNSNISIPPGGLRDDPQCIQESDKWLVAEECRRIGFSMLFDSARVTCFDLPNAHFCDYCDPDLDLLAKFHPIIIDPPIEQQEDEFAAIDSQLMNIDFEGIQELSSHPPSSTAPPALSLSSTASTSRASSSFNDPLQFAPTPGLPSMQIQRQGAYYQGILGTKQAKSKVLNAFAAKILGKCPLCWAYQGLLVPRHKERLWIQCRGPLGQGYMDVMYTDRPFKKKIQLQAYKFCYRCHLPQGDFMPPSHPDMTSGAKGAKECPFEDLIPILVVFIRKNEEWWKRACEVFTLKSNMTEAELALWYSAENVQGGFNNALEMILWFYMEKEKERKDA